MSQPPKVLSLILGGGRGTRLFPLTKHRSKPAVPVAGKFRLIDIPISNCLNSNLSRIYVLTQFLSVSLHRHIANTYKFDMFSKGFVEILAAQQAYDSNIGWYQGTADAVRQNMAYIDREEPELILILSGDQLYRMDYQQMIATHTKSGADVTIACLPVKEEQTTGFGLMKVDDAGRVTGFVEKPRTADARKPYHTSQDWIESKGIACKGRHYLANMGIYLFETSKLKEMLETPVWDPLHKEKRLPHDFGSNVFPSHVGERHIHAHLFDGYWEDLGTIVSYHECSLDLAKPEPPFDFYTADDIIFTRMRNLPASLIDGAKLENCLVADGCRIGSGSILKRCMIGVRSRIGKNCELTDTVMIGTEGFETAAELAENRKLGRPDRMVGDGTTIEGAILDRDVRIGAGVRIHCAKGKPDYDDPQERFYIRDGIVCVPRGAIIPDGLVI
jgi:glucose-1-phosphate adenylyltransferase